MLQVEVGATGAFLQQQQLWSVCAVEDFFFSSLLFDQFLFCRFSAPWFQTSTEVIYIVQRHRKREGLHRGSECVCARVCVTGRGGREESECVKW